jgi:hypothetical protein
MQQVHPHESVSPLHFWLTFWLTACSSIRSTGWREEGHSCLQGGQQHLGRVPDLCIYENVSNFSEKEATN